MEGHRPVQKFMAPSHVLDSYDAASALSGIPKSALFRIALREYAEKLDAEYMEKGASAKAS
jgi:hypothetical protein